MDGKKYALPIPRAITTGIIFEAAEKFGLEVDQEKASPEDAFDPHTGFPVRDYVPRVILLGDSLPSPYQVRKPVPRDLLLGHLPEKLLAAKEYIYKRHEEWIAHLEEWRTKRREQIL
ncbi:MAG: hypothetical protein J7J01_04510, partial [Methanophagales archaeon]|nr:hypothetical protein [Methanophagales archaeon]